MLRISLKNVFARKGRLFLNSFAVLLGVAFMSGTMVFTDTIQRTFDSLFAQINEGTDAVVRSAVSVEDPFAGEQRAEIDEAVVDAVRELDGVRFATGFADNWAIIVGADGQALNAGQGPPALGLTWVDDDDVNPLVLVDGGPPRAPDDVVVVKAVADNEGFEVGDRIRILTKAGSHDYRVSGIVRFGDADSPLGATLAVFAPETAQRVLATPGSWHAVVVAAERGVSEEELRDRLVAGLSERFSVRGLAESGEPLGDPDVDLEVLTGAQNTEEEQDEIRRQLGFFSVMLLVFAVIALFVGAFVIYNSFAITVAQRTREMGLLRAMGARSGQVMRAVVGEAAVTGLVASALGVLAGIALATGLRELLRAVGVDIPSAGIVVTGATVTIGIVVGLTVTLVASVLPARRASKVSPLAAMRDVDAGEQFRAGRRTVVGAAALTLGAGLVGFGLFVDVGNAVAVVGLGGLLVFGGMAVLGPVVAPISARVLGVRMVGDAMVVVGALIGIAGAALVVFGLVDGSVGGVLLGVVMVLFALAFVPSGLGARGVEGRLARENVLRSPKRAAATASALMIGVAIVVFLTIFAASARETIADIVDEQVRADFIVDSGFGFGGLSPRLAEEIAEVPGVEAVGGVRGGVVRVFEADAEPGDEPVRFMSAVDPVLGEVLWDLGFVEGRPTDVGFGDLAVYEGRAEKLGVAIGDTVDVGFLEGGRQNLTVTAIYENNQLAGDFVVSLETWEANVADQFDFIVAINAAPGIDLEALRAELEGAVEAYPNGSLHTAAEFSEEQAAQIDAILNLFYGLLFFAIVIAAFGIANTLALSILERTRELGLLRAVGMTRSQLRRSIRWEAVIVALFGTIGGLLVGTFFAWTVGLSLRDEGFAQLVFPGAQLFAIVVVGAALGVVSALVPARRAARLDVLEAIAHE